MSEVASYDCMLWDLYYDAWLDVTIEKARFAYIVPTVLAVIECVVDMPKQIIKRQCGMEMGSSTEFTTTSGKKAKVTSTVRVEVYENLFPVNQEC